MSAEPLAAEVAVARVMNLSAPIHAAAADFVRSRR